MFKLQDHINISIYVSVAFSAGQNTESKTVDHINYILEFNVQSMTLQKFLEYVPAISLP